MDKFLNITYSQLLLYGVHVGHSFSNSVLYSAWLVYTYMQNILIINLFKSIFLLKTGFFGIANACVFRGPVWFINLDKSASLYVKYAAMPVVRWVELLIELMDLFLIIFLYIMYIENFENIHH